MRYLLLILAFVPPMLAAEVQVKRDAQGYIWLRDLDEGICANWVAVTAINQYFPDTWQTIDETTKTHGWTLVHGSGGQCVDYIVAYNPHDKTEPNDRPLKSCDSAGNNCKTIGRVEWKTPCGSFAFNKGRFRYYHVNGGVAVCEAVK